MHLRFLIGHGEDPLPFDTGLLRNDEQGMGEAVEVTNLCLGVALDDPIEDLPFDGGVAIRLDDLAASPSREAEGKPGDTEQDPNAGGQPDSFDLFPFHAAPPELEVVLRPSLAR